MHVSIRLGEDDKLCLLVVIGVRDDGTKELLAVEGRLPREHRLLGGDDARPQSPRRQRAQARGRRLCLGDMGRAARRVPGARRQACWVHAIADVLDCLPKRLQPRAKALLHETMEAPTRLLASHPR